MRQAIPKQALLSKDAVDYIIQCVSEFISFITSEGLFCSETRDELLALLIIQ